MRNRKYYKELKYGEFTAHQCYSSKTVYFGNFVLASRKAFMTVVDTHLKRDIRNDIKPSIPDLDAVLNFGKGEREYYKNIKNV